MLYNIFLPPHAPPRAYPRDTAHRMAAVKAYPRDSGAPVFPSARDAQSA